MAYFDELNTTVNKVVEMLLKNEELMKILVFPNENISREDIYMKHIFPIPRNYDAVKDQASFINVYIDTIYPYEGNSGFRGAYLCFDVISHLDIWADEKTSTIRPYSMCALIDEMINDKKNDDVREISINPPYFNELKVYRYGETFYGYKLKYHISFDSNCGDKING